MDDDTGQHQLPWGSPRQYLTSSGQCLTQSKPMSNAIQHTYTCCACMYTRVSPDQSWTRASQETLNQFGEPRTSLRYLQKLSPSQRRANSQSISYDVMRKQMCESAHAHTKKHSLQPVSCPIKANLITVFQWCYSSVEVACLLMASRLKLLP